MKNINPPGVPAVVLPEIKPNAAYQRITYPCGCEVVGPAPMPRDCPTHGTVAAGPVEMLVSVILDESGSMKTDKQATIDGYNEYLNGLKQDGNQYLVTLSKFDEYSPDPHCRIVYKNKPIAEVEGLTTSTYTPRGATPLYDAIGTTITALAPEVNGRSVLVIIMTDGQENASHEYTANKVKALIKAKEAEGNWTFVYLGANQDAWLAGQAFGMHAGNTMNYATGNSKMVFGNLSHATMTRSGLASMGMRSTQSYFKDAGVADVNVDTVAKNAASYLGSKSGESA